MHVLSSRHWNMALQTVGTEDQTGALQWQQMLPISRVRHYKSFWYQCWQTPFH